MADMISSPPRPLFAALATVGALALLGTGVVGATTEPPTTTEPATTTEMTLPPVEAEFVVPPERITALREVGQGWLVDGVEYPEQPGSVPWPTEEWPVGELPDGVDEAAVQAALDAAFAPIEGTGGIDAVVAVQGGQLVVEQYKDTWNPEDAHVSWSMAKSITQAMLGILVADGDLDVFAPAAVPEWSAAGDPRHDITTDDLVHMRSCLEWNEEYEGQSDVITMLFGDGRADRAHFAADRPLVCEPGSQWYYSTGTMMILARLVADQVGYREEGTAWAQERLFDPIGITSVEHDLDGAGVMSGGSAINMTAEDFARFGYLYLRGGEWDGTRILPEQWVDYARLPFPDALAYGAGWWLAGSEDANSGAFQANGFAGQSITVVPELDLVVVVLANVQDSSADDAAVAVIDAFAGVAP